LTAAEITCPRCTEKLPVLAQFCGKCGQPLAQPSEAASPWQRQAAPAGLPLTSPLIGREAPLADLLAHLRAGASCGICGPEGVGKTALAAEAVARLAAEREAFPGGMAWISCEDLEGEAGLAE